MLIYEIKLLLKTTINNYKIMIFLNIHIKQFDI